MGSKRSSKNPNKVQPSPLPAAAPDGEKHRIPKNHKNPNLASPSKSHKKQKLSTPMSPDKSFLSPIPSTGGEPPSQNSNLKGKVPKNSKDISPSDGAATRSSPLRWGEAENLKVIKSLVAFRFKKGSLPTPSNMGDFLAEIKDWAPSQLSEKNLISKIRHLRSKFQKSPKPGPESSEFDRAFYEIGSQVWRPVSLNEDNSKENGMVEKRVDKRKKEKISKKLNGEKQDVDKNMEDEDGLEEEENSEDDECSGEKAERSIKVENGEEHEKDELLISEDDNLLDRDVAGYPYKYLKLALEEYWTVAKLNMDTLYSALPKVDPAKAKRLDEQFLEVFEGMLKLKMEKNKVSNDIIGASLGH